MNLLNTGHKTIYQHFDKEYVKPTAILFEKYTYLLLDYLKSAYNNGYNHPDTIAKMKNVTEMINRLIPIMTLHYKKIDTQISLVSNNNPVNVESGDALQRKMTEAYINLINAFVKPYPNSDEAKIAFHSAIVHIQDVYMTKSKNLDDLKHLFEINNLIRNIYLASSSGDSRAAKDMRDKFASMNVGKKMIVKNKSDLEIYKNFAYAIGKVGTGKHLDINTKKLPNAMLIKVGSSTAKALAHKVSQIILNYP